MKSIMITNRSVPVASLKDEYEKALIVNEGEAISNCETLRLIIKAIFQQGELEPVQEGLVQSLWSQKERLGNHQAVLPIVHQYLSHLVQSGQMPYDLYLKMLQRVSNHELETAENQLAFNTKVKINPQGVFWPDPTNPSRPRSIYDELPHCHTHKILGRATPIGSAGSCFAVEIAHQLQQDGFNYIITESNPHPTRKLHISNARWGIIFNTPSLRQLVEKAFGFRRMPRLIWTQVENGKLQVRDPFREDVVFESVEEYEQDYDRHIEATREALLKVQVFVLTLGMNEVWLLKSDGSAFSRAPWRFASSLVRRKVLTVQENVDELQRLLDIWRGFNRDIKLIISVSPVPLHATFRADEYHVVTANAHSKSTLRVAAEEFVRRNRGVFYFPSYETVTYCIEHPWGADQRHVTRATVEKVMQFFYKMFVI